MQRENKTDDGSMYEQRHIQHIWRSGPVVFNLLEVIFPITPFYRILPKIISDKITQIKVKPFAKSEQSIYY